MVGLSGPFMKETTAPLIVRIIGGVEAWVAFQMAVAEANGVCDGLASALWMERKGLLRRGG